MKPIKKKYPFLRGRYGQSPPSFIISVVPKITHAGGEYRAEIRMKSIRRGPCSALYVFFFFFLLRGKKEVRGVRCMMGTLLTIIKKILRSIYSTDLIEWIKIKN
jgi:hypothetical protein